MKAVLLISVLIIGWIAGVIGIVAGISNNEMGLILNGIFLVLISGIPMGVLIYVGLKE